MEDGTQTVDADSFIESDQIINLLASNPPRPVFLLGAWGSGKTKHAMRIKGDISKQFNVLYRSLYSIHDLRSAYLFLTPRWPKILFISATCGLVWIAGVEYKIHLSDFSWCMPANWVWPLLIGLGYGLVSNRLKLAYVFISILTCSLRKESVLIIDDLERSGLSSSDQWALLTNLWSWHQRHLILMGYDADFKRSELVERAAKLGGHIVFLAIRGSSNAAIAKQQDPNFRLGADGEWWDYLTPRDVVEITSEVNSCFNPSETSKRDVLYVNLYLNRLLDKLEISLEERSLMSFGFNGNSLSLGHYRPTSNRIQTALIQFYSSVPREIVRLWVSAPPQNVINSSLPPEESNVLKEQNLSEIRKIILKIKLPPAE